jgi:hypothetical protein
MNRCPVCADNSCRSRIEPEGFVVFECPRCGTFTLASALAGRLPAMVGKGQISRAGLSHQIRKSQRGDDEPLPIGEGDLDAWRRTLRPLTPRDQHDNLLLWIGDTQPTPGQFAHSRKKPLSAIIGCHITAQGDAESEYDWLIDQMRPLGLFESQFGQQPSVVALRLTLKGWDAYSELRRRGAVKK